MMTSDMKGNTKIDSLGCGNRIGAISRTALLRSARSSGDAYRTMYFLEQLRWCGDKSDAVEIAKIGAESNSKAVADFAAMVCREIKGP